MPIQAETQKTVAEQVIPAQVYDRYWLSRLVIHAPSPAEDARVVAELRLASDSQLDPESTPVVLELASIFAAIPDDPEIGLLVQSLTAKLGQVAKAKHAYNQAIMETPEDAAALHANALAAAAEIWPGATKQLAAIRLSGSL